MVEEVEPEALLRKGVIYTVDTVTVPVRSHALGTQHQHALVQQGVVVDNGQGFVGLAQAHAVRQDAAVEAIQHLQHGLHAVALVGEKGLPYLRIVEARAALHIVLRQFFVGQQLVAGQIINPSGRVRAGKKDEIVPQGNLRFSGDLLHRGCDGRSLTLINGYAGGNPILRQQPQPARTQ